MDRSEQRYDAVPYESHPTRFCDPARLEALGHLWGLDPAAAATARVLELGGGDGANILPMAAAAPGGRFLCIDVSGRAVERGRAAAQALGLDHLEFRHQSIEDLPDHEGPWDYIVAHGVWSWIPPEARRRLLEICGHQLAPHGVAYVSYNTQPGWMMREALRQMMLQHTRGMEDLGATGAAAGELLDFLCDSQLPGQSAWKAMLEEERQLIRDHGPDYVLHEHLSPDNRAVWFHEFVARAAAVGLQYMGEANPTHQFMAHHDPSVERRLGELAPHRLQRESVMDWVRGRMFRKTLLVHQGLPLRREVLPEHLGGYWLGARVEAREGAPDLRDGVRQVFQGRGGEIASSAALVKAVLWSLVDAGSADLRLGDLWERAVEHLGRAGLMAREGDRHALGEGMLEWWRRGEIDLVRSPRPVAGLGPRPRATALARYQATRGDSTVANLRHEPVALRPAGLKLLPLVDGTRDRQALLTALVDLASRGQLGVTSGGQPVIEHGPLRAALGEVLERELALFARSALLDG